MTILEAIAPIIFLAFIVCSITFVWLCIVWIYEALLKWGYKMNENEIAELILRRRRQVWVHSIIYYELNANLISDHQWSKWALELENLQNQYPKIAANVKYAREFKDFDHSTGHNLPMDDIEIYSMAYHLLEWSKQK